MIAIVKELLREAIQPSGALNEKELRAVRLIGGAAVLIFLFFVWTAFSFLLPQKNIKYALDGQVSLQGAPIKDGEIKFCTTNQESGVDVSVKIKNGRFMIGASSGLSVNEKYKIEVKGFRPTGELYENSDMSKSTPILEQFLPPRFNIESNLTFDATRQTLRKPLILDLK